MHQEPFPFPRLLRVYALLLRLYPARCRADYAQPMLQLFRDQCRDLARARGRGAVPRIWRLMLQDVFVSVLQEHLSNLTNAMKSIKIHQLSHLLFAAAVLFALFSSPSIGGIALATAFVYLSSLALLARAVVEVFRPRNELLQSLVWGAVVAVAYGLILPFWARLHAIHGAAFAIIPALHATAALLNPVVPLLKTVIALARPQVR